MRNPKQTLKMDVKNWFSGRAKRVEYLIYIVIEIIANIVVLYLNKNVSLDDRTVIYLFYIYLIILIFFIPIQAVTTRRMRDIGINGGWIFLNFIPIVNVIFKIYLCLANSKSFIQKINVTEE